MPTIHEYWQKIKTSADRGVGEWGLAALLFISGLGAFGLGRLSALEDVRPPVSMITAPAAAAVRTIPLGGQFVASSRGKTYYFPWCSGALSIRSDSQIWFANEAEAQRAGYKPSKSCKGLGSG